MKKLTLAAALLTTVFGANIAKADDYDFLVRLAGKASMLPKVDFAGKYNQGPGFDGSKADGTWDAGAPFNVADKSYSIKLPGVALDIMMKINPFIGVELGGGWTGRNETTISLMGAFASKLSNNASINANIYPAKTPSVETPVRVQGFYGRGGVNLQWANSSGVTPFVGAFLGYEHRKFDFNSDKLAYTFEKKEIGTKNIFIYGAKVGANIMMSESGFGLSANYVIQNDPEDQGKYTFSFSDDAVNTTDSNKAAPNKFEIKEATIKNKTKMQHGIEIGLAHAF